MDRQTQILLLGHFSLALSSSYPSVTHFLPISVSKKQHIHFQDRLELVYTGKICAAYEPNIFHVTANELSKSVLLRMALDVRTCRQLSSVSPVWAFTYPYVTIAP